MHYKSVPRGAREREHARVGGQPYITEKLFSYQNEALHFYIANKQLVNTLFWAIIGLNDTKTTIILSFVI